MSILPIPELSLPKDSPSDKIAQARKAIGAGVSAGFGAAVALFVTSYSGGVSIEEVGQIIAAFVSTGVVTGYVTWQTVNHPTPSDKAALINAVSAVPPIVVQAPLAPPEYVGLPPLPKDPNVEEFTEYEPKHSAE